MDKEYMNPTKQAVLSWLGYQKRELDAAISKVNDAYLQMASTVPLLMEVSDGLKALRGIRDNLDSQIDYYSRKLPEWGYPPSITEE